MASCIDSYPLVEPLTAHLARLDAHDWLFDEPGLHDDDLPICWLSQ